MTQTSPPNILIFVCTTCLARLDKRQHPAFLLVLSPPISLSHQLTHTQIKVTLSNLISASLSRFLFLPSRRGSIASHRLLWSVFINRTVCTWKEFMKEIRITEDSTTRLISVPALTAWNMSPPKNALGSRAGWQKNHQRALTLPSPPSGSCSMAR